MRTSSPSAPHGTNDQMSPDPSSRPELIAEAPRLTMASLRRNARGFGLPGRIVRFLEGLYEERQDRPVLDEEWGVAALVASTALGILTTMDGNSLELLSETPPVVERPLIRRALIADPLAYTPAFEDWVRRQRETLAVDLARALASAPSPSWDRRDVREDLNDLREIDADGFRQLASSQVEKGAWDALDVATLFLLNALGPGGYRVRFQDAAHSQLSVEALERTRRLAEATAAAFGNMVPRDVQWPISEAGAARDLAAVAFLNPGQLDARPIELPS